MQKKIRNNTPSKSLESREGGEHKNHSKPLLVLNLPVHLKSHIFLNRKGLLNLGPALVILVQHTYSREKKEDIFFQAHCNLPSFLQWWEISFPVLHTHNSIKSSPKPDCPRERPISLLQHSCTECTTKVPDEVHTDETYPCTYKKAYPHTYRLTNSLGEPSMHTQKCMWPHEKICTQVCLQSQKGK